MDQPPRKRGRPKGSKSKTRNGVPIQQFQKVVALPGVDIHAFVGPHRPDELGGEAADLPPSPIQPHVDPLQFLLGVMNNPGVDPALRVRAAVTACQYKHTRRADGGKREEAAERAKKASTGRFAPPKGPTLVHG